ncbi:DUF4240 domain-containing protein [Jidongwangia harbinensis]|uniref:DUF4240 domain-containing protein n=1 Tax=Jidongwangia harbinensis TaxID=2878561 RepID=UPI001CD964B8|nr:DUF4240 domain-containing protein [Jidongwangia harbinensis]MCA2214106.1 DUF4240 domain-containing protein [Jidongwangia harbinensis]
MDSETFWNLVGLVGGYPPSDEVSSFAGLEAALMDLDRGEILSFEDKLAECLYVLDRRSFADVQTIDTGRAQSNDSFLYNRCAVVVAGEVAYNEVLSSVRSFQDFTHSHVPSSEGLLYVAQKAYERAVGEPWQHNSPHDYETGSNEEGWT